MLGCERKLPASSTIGIRPHWDQSFVIENADRQELVSSDALLRRLLREFCEGQQNVTSVVTSCPRHITSVPHYVNNNRCCPGRQEKGEKDYYVNVPNNTDGGSNVSSVSARMDLSPMSGRGALIPATACDRSSAVAQVALSRLRESGFYHGSISSDQACDLLRCHPPGTFLVRDSSDKRYLFSLTLRIDESAVAGFVGRNSGCTSVRIVLEQNTGLFRLDGDHRRCEAGSCRLPSFPCVLDLLQRHTAPCGVGSTEFVLRDRKYYLDGFGFSIPETPLLLRQPLYTDPGTPASLRHLCRRRIHSAVAGRSVDRLQLMPSLKQYLNDYPSDL